MKKPPLKQPNPIVRRYVPIPKDLAARIDDYLDATGVPFARLTRFLLQLHINEWEENNKPQP